jgi:hypothetical protein
MLSDILAHVVVADLEIRPHQFERSALVRRVGGNHLGALIAQSASGRRPPSRLPVVKALAELPQIAEGTRGQAVTLQFRHHLRLGGHRRFRSLQAVAVDRVDARNPEVDSEVR